MRDGRGAMLKRGETLKTALDMTRAICQIMNCFAGRVQSLNSGPASSPFSRQDPGQGVSGQKALGRGRDPVSGIDQKSFAGKPFEPL